MRVVRYLGILFLAPLAWGSDEWLIRYRDSDVVVKKSFSSAQESIRVRQKLRSSLKIQRISPNFHYRPAIHLNPSQAQEVRPEAPFILPWFLNFERFSAALLPEVALPLGPGQDALDPLAPQDWAWNQIHMPEDREVGEAPVTVAVIDSGVDYNHEDLVGAMWRNPANPREVGFDFAHGHAQPYDVVRFDMDGCLKDSACALGVRAERFLTNPGHGTHCAGHVGAVANNGLGIRGMGSQARVQIMALKFFYDAGEPNEGQGDDAAAIQSFEYAIRNGARVISASWGGPILRDQAQKSELKRELLRARDAGVLVVVAAGNDGVDQDSVLDPTYPAAYDLDNLIVVAASDATDQLADFSNFGAKSVHLAAPGVKIFSTIVGSGYGDVLTRFQDSKGRSRQMNWDGTSMAAPIVAGAVGLVWSKFPGENYHQIRDRILGSVRKVPALDGKVLSGGVLDVSAALSRSLPLR